MRLLRVRQTVVVIVGVLGQVAHIALGELVGKAVVVRIVEHGQGEGEGFAVERIVGPNSQVHRFAGLQRRAANAAVKTGISSRAPAEGQPFG